LYPRPKTHVPNSAIAHSRRVGGARKERIVRVKGTCDTSCDDEIGIVVYANLDSQCMRPVIPAIIVLPRPRASLR
jgi:hypothetical protein